MDHMCIVRDVYGIASDIVFNVPEIHNIPIANVMILHYNTTLTPSSKAIYSGTKYYETHIEFHSLFLDVSSTDV